MKSVGEAMALGRNFTEALQKALRSLDTVSSRLFHWEGEVPTGQELQDLVASTSVATVARLLTVQQALRAGASVAEVHEANELAPWCVDQTALTNDVSRSRPDARLLPDWVL